MTARCVDCQAAGLQIREALATRDPSNSQWQTDVTISCAKLGVAELGVPLDEKLAFPLRGQQILMTLKVEGRLLPSQEWTAWLEQKVSKLTAA